MRTTIETLIEERAGLVKMMEAANAPRWLIENAAAGVYDGCSRAYLQFPNRLDSDLAKAEVVLRTGAAASAFHETEFDT